VTADGGGVDPDLAGGPEVDGGRDAGGHAGSEATSYVEALGLERHPEGGWFRRMWTHPARDADGRALASSIHYLLGAGERSHWHRIDAAETWCWHAGHPLRLHTSSDAHTITEVTLGPDAGAGHVLQATVAPDCWQAAELATAASAASAPAATPGFSLVSCLVVPEFRFEHFELAPPDWSPA
jgi:uncharacterized protein